MEREKIIKETVRIIRRYLPRGYKIILFGSWTKGTAHEGSDLDIGILGRGAVPEEVMRRITHEVEGIPTLRTIEVVDLRSKSEPFRRNALKSARPLSYVR